MTEKTAPTSPDLPDTPGDTSGAAPAATSGETASLESESKSGDSPWWVVLWVIALIGVVVSPGVVWAGLGSRPFVMRLDMMAMMTLMVGAFALVLVAVLSRGFRTRMRWALGVTAVVIFVVFQWPVLTEMGSVVARRLSLPIISEIAPAILASLLVVVAVRRSNDKAFGIALALAVVAFAVVVSGGLAPFLPIRPSPVSAQPAAVGAPDAVLVVFDGYSRDDVLEEQFGFDNAELLAELEKRGFVVPAEATANYNSTFASISTMLASDYTYPAGVLDGSHNAGMRDSLAGDSVLIRRFQEAGYDVAYTESSWSGSTCSALVDVCIRDGLTYRSAWVLGQTTLFAPLLDRWMPHQFNAVSMRHLNNLADYTERGRSDGTPRLTIAHVILPHPPFEREADCSRRGRLSEQTVKASGSGGVSVRRARYVDQAKCTNDRLIAALDEIIAAHPDVLVMLTADHGSATTVSADNTEESRSDEVLLERMAIFSAYRLPNCDAEVAASITPVNGTRLLTNCALGSSLDPVEDRSLWIPPNRSGSVVDVTSRVRN